MPEAPRYEINNGSGNRWTPDQLSADRIGAPVIKLTERQSAFIDELRKSTFNVVYPRLVAGAILFQDPTPTPTDLCRAAGENPHDPAWDAIRAGCINLNTVSNSPNTTPNHDAFFGMLCVGAVVIGGVLFANLLRKGASEQAEKDAIKRSQDDMLSHGRSWELRDDPDMNSKNPPKKLIKNPTSFAQSDAPIEGKVIHPKTRGRRNKKTIVIDGDTGETLPREFGYTDNTNRGPRFLRRTDDN